MDSILEKLGISNTKEFRKLLKYVNSPVFTSNQKIEYNARAALNHLILELDIITDLLEYNMSDIKIFTKQNQNVKYLA